MAGIGDTEHARRRHIGSSSTNGCTRKSFFCLHVIPHLSSTSSVKKSMIRHACQEDGKKLASKAKEAKERLDQKLGTQRKSNGKIREGLIWSSGEERCNNMDNESELERVVHCRKSNGSSIKLKRWGRQSWEASNQKEFCAVCLERFRGGDTLLHLPCAHCLHSECVLDNNEKCPCCRLGIITLFH